MKAQKAIKELDLVIAFLDGIEEATYWKHDPALTGAFVVAGMRLHAVKTYIELGEIRKARKPPITVPETHSNIESIDNLTDWEKQYIVNQEKCPDCKEGELLLGPRGGVSVNYICSNCQHKFNIAFANEFQIFIAHRI